MFFLFWFFALVHQSGGLLPDAGAALLPEPGFVMADDGPRVRKNVVFAERDGFADRFTSLDIYRPRARHDEAGGLPILVYVHGGGWAVGDKRSVHLRPEWAERNGWIVVSLNYRLSPKVVHPEHARDVAAGVGWVLDNAAGFGGDRERVVVMGHSAGAHLVAIVATDPGLLGEVGHEPTDLAGVVLLDSGTYDIASQLESRWVKGTRRKMLEGAFGTDPQALEKASPMFWAGKAEKLPPVMAVYAGDRYWSRVESQRLIEIWKSRSTRALTHHAPDKNHAGINRLLGTPGDADTEAVEAFMKWAFGQELDAREP